jgi:hypothetical protein
MRISWLPSARGGMLHLMLCGTVATRGLAQAMPPKDSATLARTDTTAHIAMPHAPATWMRPLTGFRRELLSASTPTRVLLGATFDQVSRSPDVWPRTLEGFGSRSGVRLAEIGAQLGVLYGTAAVLRQDVTYRPVHAGSGARRTWHAIAGSVTAYRRDGSRTFAPGTFTGAVAGALVVRELLPRTTSRSEIIGHGTSLLLNRVIRNIWYEFLTPAPSPSTPQK